VCTGAQPEVGAGTLKASRTTRAGPPAALSWNHHIKPYECASSPPSTMVMRRIILCSAMPRSMMGEEGPILQVQMPLQVHVSVSLSIDCKGAAVDGGGGADPAG